MFCRKRPGLSKQAHALGFRGWNGKLRVSLALLQLHPKLERGRFVEDGKWGQNGSLCAQLPQKLSCDPLLGAEPVLCVGVWPRTLTTGQGRGGWGISVSRCCFFGFVFFFLKLNFSCQMRNTDFRVSWEKLEWVNHKSSELRRGLRRAQALPWWKPQLVEAAWALQGGQAGDRRAFGMSHESEGKSGALAPASGAPRLGSTAPLFLSARLIRVSSVTAALCAEQAGNAV